MDDLISRKALLEDIKAAAGNDFMGTMGACTLTRFVKKQPAVDAEPVVHGWWDNSGRFKFFDCDIAVRCSMCGGCLTEKEYAESVWNFCPVCGAKMDGGNDND